MAEGEIGSQWDDFELTKEDVKNFGEALKKEEFRKLLVDYVEEVNDPENRRQYQEEITTLEKERGYDVTFVNPQPGYVVKTSVDGKKKAFINVCKSDKVAKPTSVPATNTDKKGMNWSVPLSQIQPRDDLDKSGKRCQVYDVVFHPETLELARSSSQFKSMVTEIALDAVEKNFSVKLDRKNLRYPKIKYKGGVSNSVIRKKSEKPPEKILDDEQLSQMNYPFFKHMQEPSTCSKPKKLRPETGRNSKTTPYTTPTYLIKYRSPVDIQEYVNDKCAKINAAIPKALVVEIDLPLLSSTTNVELDVNEKSLSLKSEKQAKYKLGIELPYSVNAESGNAKFDKSQKKLIITLPVTHSQQNTLIDIGREDSGVESDIGCRTSESGSGDDDNTGAENIKCDCSENNLIDTVRTELTKSVVDGESRTNNLDGVEKFLDSDKHYSLPSFTCNVFDLAIAFTLHVKNVDPSSVNHRFLTDCSGVAVKFTSVGSGHFPLHHAFCVKFPPDIIVDQTTFSVEPWDNNVILQLQLIVNKNQFTVYYVGTEESSLVEHSLPEPTALGIKFEELQQNALNSPTDCSFTVEAVEATKDEVTLEIKSKKDTKPDDSSSETIESFQQEQHDELATNQNNMHQQLTKSRTFSESSGEDINLSPKKGILKYKGRVCRSLSESSVDEYSWSSSLDVHGQSGGSDSCIPEEEETETGQKKTVRFNDDISEKIYRSNSSILGQRKKNQRKIRNKKRAQERRASESENSEGEVDREKDKDSDRDYESDTAISDLLLEKEGISDCLNTNISDSKGSILEPQPQVVECVFSEKVVDKDLSQVPQLQLENDLLLQLHK